MAHFTQPDCWCASLDDEMCESDEVERAASAGALHNFYPLEANLYPGERMLRPFPGLLLWDVRDPPGPLGCSIAYVPPPLGWTTLYTNAGLQLHVWVGDMRPQAQDTMAASGGAAVTAAALSSSTSASGAGWRPPAGTLLPNCNGQTQVVGLNLPPAPPVHEHRCIACGRRGLNVDVVPIGGSGGAGGCVGGGRMGDQQR
ncbi:hypothetical protein BOX15_Mlig028713g1 [Macrostomum lignano]|uniref:Uncharacterized protein n=1 Tax=Macrostomum lignano TaxID=282301 RepID=A0A267GRK8_9PLAT|nr:hypothetical protein BOX15_Mlig028713g1 [Macrostomum lignano]